MTSEYYTPKSKETPSEKLGKIVNKIPITTELTILHRKIDGEPKTTEQLMQLLRLYTASQLKELTDISKTGKWYRCDVSLVIDMSDDEHPNRKYYLSQSESDLDKQSSTNAACQGVIDELKRTMPCLVDKE
jgi:hypothetical protein